MQFALFVERPPVVPLEQVVNPARCVRCRERRELTPDLIPRYNMRPMIRAGFYRCRFDPLWVFRGAQARCDYGRSDTGT